MKQHWTKLIVWAAICLLIAACVGALAEPSGDWTYVVEDDGSATITAYDGADGAISAPKTLDGHAVLKIGENVFNGKQTLTAVTLPEGLQVIGAGAFRDSSIASVNLPLTLTTLGDDAFNGCTALTSDVLLPAGLTAVGANAFKDTGISGIEFVDGLETIGDGAFENCASLSHVDLPLSLASIGRAAFQGCGLSDINLPRSALVCVKNAQGELDDAACSFDAGVALHTNDWDWIIVGGEAKITGWRGSDAD